MCDNRFWRPGWARGREIYGDGKRLLNPSAENPDLPAAQRARKTGPIIRIECASRNLLIGPVHRRFSAEKEEGFQSLGFTKDACGLPAGGLKPLLFLVPGRSQFPSHHREGNMPR